jgi:hypothetical protein
MKTWMIVAIVAAIAAMVYFFTRKKTLPEAPTPVATTLQTAPGVDPATGYPRPMPPPPPPERAANVQVANPSAVAAVTRMLKPPTLANVPIVGKVASIPQNAVKSINTKVNATLEHVPVVGKALAAPGKAIAKVGSIFGF